MHCTNTSFLWGKHWTGCRPRYDKCRHIPIHDYFSEGQCSHNLCGLLCVVIVAVLSRVNWDRLVSFGRLSIAKGLFYSVENDDAVSVLFGQRMIWLLQFQLVVCNLRYQNRGLDFISLPAKVAIKLRPPTNNQTP